MNLKGWLFDLRRAKQIRWWCCCIAFVVLLVANQKQRSQAQLAARKTARVCWWLIKNQKTRLVLFWYAPRFFFLPVWVFWFAYY